MMTSARKHDEMRKQMERLYTTFYQQLFLYALTIVDQEEEARDVVSDVFSLVWNQWTREEDITPVNSSYLYKLTKTKCLDRLRRDKARNNYAAFLSHVQLPETDDEVHLYEHHIECLREAIASLPEPGKTILDYCYFQRLTYQQTADKMQLSIVVVRKNMLKVFKILREKLNKATK
jgi:RNA polymerase sigma-70 factor (ECF subfamily)